MVCFVDFFSLKILVAYVLQCIETRLSNLEVSMNIWLEYCASQKLVTCFGSCMKPFDLNAGMLNMPLHYIVCLIIVQLLKLGFFFL